MIKKLLTILLPIVALLLLIPAFLPAHFSMSRSIEIHVPVSIVFTKLTNLNDYNKWNPFPEGDPTNQAIITGDGVGSFLEWKGEKTGEGKMTITHIETDKKVTVKMDFYKPMKGEGIVQWVTSAKSDTSTNMTWTFEQDLPYFNRYFGIFMDRMMGGHFEKGLVHFKSLVEGLNESLNQK